METETLDKTGTKKKEPLLIDLNKLTEGEKIEMKKLGILSESNKIVDSIYPEVHSERPPIEKHVVHAPQVINEAYNYQKPSSFSRALRLDLGDYRYPHSVRRSHVWFNYHHSTS